MEHPVMPIYGGYPLKSSVIPRAQARYVKLRTVYAHTNAKLSMGWVDPRVGLGQERFQR